MDRRRILSWKKGKEQDQKQDQKKLTGGSPKHTNKKIQKYVELNNEYGENLRI